MGWFRLSIGFWVGAVAAVGAQTEPQRPGDAAAGATLSILVDGEQPGLTALAETLRRIWPSPSAEVVGVGATLPPDWGDQGLRLGLGRAAAPSLLARESGQTWLVAEDQSGQETGIRHLELPELEVDLARLVEATWPTRRRILVISSRPAPHQATNWAQEVIRMRPSADLLVRLNSVLPLLGVIYVPDERWVVEGFTDLASVADKHSIPIVTTSEVGWRLGASLAVTWNLTATGVWLRDRIREVEAAGVKTAPAPLRAWDSGRARMRGERRQAQWLAGFDSLRGPTRGGS